MLLQCFIGAPALIQESFRMCRLRTQVDDSFIYWHSKISNGVPEGPLPKPDVEIVVGGNKARRGVRQYYPLSPPMFNVYSELITRDALVQWKYGNEIGVTNTTT